MKKYISIILVMLLLAGCSVEQPKEETAVQTDVTIAEENDVKEESEDKAEKIEVETGTIVYASERGDIEVPADPERIVILDSSAAGSILMFDGSVVGHEQWTGSNPLFAEYLNESTEVSVDNLEQIMALSPDLIITSSSDKNFEELLKIAPTVGFTYGRLNYLDTIVEYGKLVNKESEALKWVEDFKGETARVGKSMKEIYGDDVSISVIEAYGEEMYLYGDNWGRGTQIVYQEMGLVMTEAVKEVALTDGYYSISAEVIPEYAADLMILSYFEGANTAFMETETWQNIEAVEKGQVLKAEAEKFYMTGPITLDYQLDEIEAFFVK